MAGCIDRAGNRGGARLGSGVGRLCSVKPEQEETGHTDQHTDASRNG